MTHPPRACKQEDEKIVELVARVGAKRWSLIAKELPGRIGKQCRERCAAQTPPPCTQEPQTHAHNPNIQLPLRICIHMHPCSTRHLGRGVGDICLVLLLARWHNHLDPTIKRGDWSREEDCMLVAKHAEFGNAWVSFPFARVL